jgi:hypothetical protein
LEPKREKVRDTGGGGGGGGGGGSFRSAYHGINKAGEGGEEKSVDEKRKGEKKGGRRGEIGPENGRGRRRKRGVFFLSICLPPTNKTMEGKKEGMAR